MLHRFVSKFVTVSQQVTAVYTLTPYIQRPSGEGILFCRTTRTGNLPGCPDSLTTAGQSAERLTVCSAFTQPAHFQPAHCSCFGTSRELRTGLSLKCASTKEGTNVGLHTTPAAGGHITGFLATGVQVVVRPHTATGQIMYSGSAVLLIRNINSNFFSGSVYISLWLMQEWQLILCCTL